MKIIAAALALFLVPLAPVAYRQLATPSAATLDHNFLDAFATIEAGPERMVTPELQAALERCEAAGDDERGMELMIDAWATGLTETRAFAVKTDAWFGTIQQGIDRGTYRLSDFSPKTIECYRNWLNDGPMVARMPQIAEIMATVAFDPPMGLTGPDRVYAQKKADAKIAQVLNDPRIVAALNGN